MIRSPRYRRVVAVGVALALLVFAACGGAKPEAGATDDASATDEPAADTDVGSTAESAPGSMQAISELADSRVIHWTVVGDYSGDVLVLNVGTSGYAPVTDHVEMGFDITSEGNGGLTGEPTITNFPSVMGDLRNGADGCRAPTVSGPYEHTTIEQLKPGLGGQLAMVVRTDYPQGAVPVACTGGNQVSPARSSTTETELVVPGIGLLMMADQMTGSEMRVSPDKRSIIVSQRGWTYTFTPSKGR